MKNCIPLAMVLALCGSMTALGLDSQPVYKDPSGNQTITQSSGTSLTVSGVLKYDGKVITVTDYGANGSDAIDDRAAIQNAINAAKILGEAVYFPPGNYLVDVSSASLSLDNVGLIGPSVVDGRYPFAESGATLSITGTANPALLVGRNVQIRNMAFYYPAQTDSSTPTAYAPTVRINYGGSDVQFVYIENCVFANSYKAIDIPSGGGSGHVWIVNNGIYGIDTGLHIGTNPELIHVLNNHFTFGVAEGLYTEAGTRSYTRASGAALRYDEGDGLDIRGNLFFGYRWGVLIVGTAATGKGVVLSNISDNFFDQCREGITASQSGSLGQTTINNNRFLAFNSQNLSAAGYAIYLVGTDGTDKLTITGNYFGQATSAHIACDNATNGSLLITGNTFEGVGYGAAGGSPANLSLFCPNKNVVFSGNYVTDDGFTSRLGIKTYFNVTRGVRHLNATGNTFINKSTALDVQCPPGACTYSTFNSVGNISQ